MGPGDKPGLAAVDERRASAERGLERADFVAATVHEHEAAVRARPPGRERWRERRIRLRAAADLDDARHAGNPAVSSRPSTRLAFWTACPAAPFNRLSMADVTSTVGVRIPASIVAEMRTTFR